MATSASSQTMDHLTSAENLDDQVDFLGQPSTRLTASHADMRSRSEARQGLQQRKALAAKDDTVDSLIKNISLFVAAQKEKSEMVLFKQSVNDKIQGEFEANRRTMQERNETDERQKNALQASIDNLSAKLLEHAEAQGEMSSTISLMNGRLVSLEEGMASTQREMRSSHDQLLFLSTKVNDLEEQIRREKEQAHGVQDRDVQVEHNFETIRNDMTSLDTRISQANTALECLSAEDLTAVRDLVPKAEKLIDFLERNQYFESRLDKFYSQLDNPVRGQGKADDQKEAGLIGRSQSSKNRMHVESDERLRDMTSHTLSPEPGDEDLAASIDLQLLSTVQIEEPAAGTADGSEIVGIAEEIVDQDRNAPDHQKPETRSKSRVRPGFANPSNMEKMQHTPETQDLFDSQSTVRAEMTPAPSSQAVKRKRVHVGTAEVSNPRKKQKRPEFHAFKELYAQFCEEYRSKQPKNEAQFAWRFVRAIKDKKIHDWVLDALKTRCPDVIVAKHKKGQETPFSFNKQFNWERLRDALNGYDIPNDIRYSD